MIEPAGDTRTHILPKNGYTGRRNTYLEAFLIHASSYIPTYNMQHPIQIDTYIILVSK